MSPRNKNHYSLPPPLPLGGFRPMYEAFLAGDLTTRLELIDSIEQSPSCRNLSIAGQMAIDLAWDLPVEHELKPSLFGRAMTLHQRALEQNNVQSTRLNRNAAKSLIDLSSMNLYWQISSANSPNNEQVEKYYRDLLEIAMTMVDDCDYYASKKDSANLGKLNGSLSELKVIMLLNRLSIQKIGDGSYVAIPSRFKENQGTNKISDVINDSWDVSVYARTRQNEAPEIAHKIQVKNRIHAIDNTRREYSPDITVIHVYEDLTIARSKIKTDQPGLNSMIFDMVAELQGDVEAGKRLDLATAKLLDKLG